MRNGRRKMKKWIMVLTLISLVIFSFPVYASEDSMTPENLCGIWEGNYVFIPAGRELSQMNAAGKILITPDLRGLFSWNSYGYLWQEVLDGQGDINSNNLIIRDRENPDIIRVKANLTGNNKLEGEIQTKNSKGSFSNFKKVRDLTSEEKQWSLSQLEGLIKK
jgi:hypothetical protein